jgi:predicted choloylglycine hydrolase
LPGNTVELLQIAPLGSLIFEHCSHLAIRVETAQEIEVESNQNLLMINQNINIALIGNPNTGKLRF